MQIALIGIGGYGQAYINFFKYELEKDLELIAAMEPFPEQASGTAELRQRQIPIYRSIEELYAHETPELVIIASPIPYHKAQAIYAMEHGSHVLCEKPLVPTLAEALELKQVSLRTHRLLGVGFQWSFSDTMLALKEDLLHGILGKPLFFKTHISWRRNLEYYTSSTWKGRIRTASGDLVYDSIITNATAHYLHNIFFINGDFRETAAMPISLAGCLGRTYPIETFDTCFLKGELANGCQFLHIATHSGKTNSEPKLEYRFENATVYYDSNLDETLFAIFSDGTRKDYGKPLSGRESSQKVSRMAQAIRTHTSPCCSVDTILPHLITSHAIFDQLPVIQYPAELHRTDGSFHYTEGLYEQTVACYQNETLPEGHRFIHL